MDHSYNTQRPANVVQCWAKIGNTGPTLKQRCANVISYSKHKTVIQCLPDVDPTSATLAKH